METGQSKHERGRVVSHSSLMHPALAEAGGSPHCPACRARTWCSAERGSLHSLLTAVLPHGMHKAGTWMVPACQACLEALPGYRSAMAGMPWLGRLRTHFEPAQPCVLHQISGGCMTWTHTMTHSVLAKVHLR